MTVRANQGKGAALKTGFRFAAREGYEALITIDADAQHDPDDIPLLLEAAAHAPFVIGSRMHAAATMPRIIYLSNWIGSRLVSCFTPHRIYDSQSGFRFLRRAVFNAALPSENGYDFETAFLIRAARAGHTVQEVPIKTIFHTKNVRSTIIGDTFAFFRLFGAL